MKQYQYQMVFIEQKTNYSLITVLGFNNAIVNVPVLLDSVSISRTCENLVREHKFRSKLF